MKVNKIGNFKFIKTSLKGAMLIEVIKRNDLRGCFMETYHYPSFCKAGITSAFVQDNESTSHKGVLRGMHFQTENIQGKLVRVLQGEIYDVIVDLRKASPTYGEWEGFLLDSIKGNQLYVPEGFAHGFLVMSEEATIAYKCTDVYNPNAVGGLKWDDASVGIKWPTQHIGKVILSEADEKLPSLNQQELNF